MKSDRELRTDLRTSVYELLAPANNKQTAKKAILAGADAVYIGYNLYGARAQAGNSFEDIIEVIEFAHIYRAKVYITLNTILKDEELNSIEKLIHQLYEIKADGIIIQDMGILELNLPPIPIIASTQCHNYTVDRIKFLEKTGFKRVILPRETSLKEIEEIKENTNIELESFVHGALCVSYSGQCYLSYAIGGRSANRGECAQPCRRKYSLIDANGNEIIKNKYILSLKDFNLSERIEELILAGITSFKIEGRLKNETYVVNITSYYRDIIDKVLNTYGLKRASQGISKNPVVADIYKSFNRGFTEFNITGNGKNIATVNYSSSLGEFIGITESTKKNYFKLNTNILNNGDGICFFNEYNELIGTNINKTEGNIIYPANIKGIKAGTKIYRNYNKEFDDEISKAEPVRKLPVNIKVRETSMGYLFIMTDEEQNSSCYMVSKKYEAAQQQEKAKNTTAIQLSKTGGSEFEIIKTDIKLKEIPFIRVSEINEIRRQLIEKLRKIRRKNFKQSERKTLINKIQYPEPELDYKANISNAKAKQFYIKRGVNVKEYALELQKNTKNKDLMTSKYCIKNQLGLCSKQTPKKKYKEPFVLKDEFNKEYLVEFNCKDCIMKIRSWD